MKLVGRKVMKVRESVHSSLMDLAYEKDKSTKLVQFVVNLCILSYDIDGIELHKYAEVSGVDLEDGLASLCVSEAYHAGALCLQEDALTLPIINLRPPVSEEWQNYARILMDFRSSFFGREEGQKRVKEMRIGRVKCGICGMFNVTNFDEVEVLWPKFSKQPHAKARCTTCGRFVISKIGSETALFFETAGVKTSHWSENSFDEADVKDFVENMEDEIRFLLS